MAPLGLVTGRLGEPGWAPLLGTRDPTASGTAHQGRTGPVADPRTQAREGGDRAAQNCAQGSTAQAASSVPAGPGPPYHPLPVPRRPPCALTSPPGLQKLEPQSPLGEAGTPEATKRS